MRPKSQPISTFQLARVTAHATAHTFDAEVAAEERFRQVDMLQRNRDIVRRPIAHLLARELAPGTKKRGTVRWDNLEHQR